MLWRGRGALKPDGPLWLLRHIMGIATKRHLIGIGQRLPADPCHTTVRTGPYTAVRGVALALIGQRRKTERAEVGIGQAEMQGLVLTGGPRTAEAGRRITGQRRSHAKCNQSRPASARGSPLPPQGAAESTPNPTGQ